MCTVIETWATFEEDSAYGALGKVGGMDSNKFNKCFFKSFALVNRQCAHFPFNVWKDKGG